MPLRKSIKLFLCAISICSLKPIVNNYFKKFEACLNIFVCVIVLYVFKHSINQYMQCCKG